ncbi:MAG: hypothetical protein HQ483_19015 [Rhodospirillales bacterium]|nr:hypothetical protein [Rhodospirillales bacterium]
MAIQSVLSSAISGLHKSAGRAHESASKIVNLTTPSRPQGPTSNPIALTGNTAIDAQLIGAGETDLARELVNLIQAKAAYSANAQVIRASESLSRVTSELLA